MSKHYCGSIDECCVYFCLEECKYELSCPDKIDSKKPSYESLEQQNAELLNMVRYIIKIGHGRGEQKYKFARAFDLAKQTLAKWGGDE